MHETWIVYSTTPTKDEALFISRMLLEEKLIACANIHGDVESLYLWEGALEQQAEHVLVLKTSARNVEGVIARIRELHSYALPAVTAWAAGSGSAPFFQWVNEQTR